MCYIYRLIFTFKIKERKKLVREGFLSFRMKNFFLRWKNRCKNEQEALKNGRELNYWHGEDAWDVFQSKEREKLGGEGFLSFRTKKNFWDEKNGWKSEKEALKNGGELNYWHGEEAWEIFQSKEREKLGGEGFLSFKTKKKFWDEKNGCKSEEEALKNGGEFKYWLGEEAW